jgi:hypothetical protein
MNEDFKNEDVHLYSDATGWRCIAKTGNWAGDYFDVTGKSREDVVKKMRASIKRDGGEKWLLSNELLKLPLASQSEASEDEKPLPTIKE